MDGDTWLAFGARDVMKGVFWVFIFIKKLFFLHIILHLCFFHVTFWGKITCKKEKKSLIWTLDPKEKRAHNLEKQDAS